MQTLGPKIILALLILAPTSAHAEEPEISEVMKKYFLVSAEQAESERAAALAKVGARPDPKVSIGAARKRNLACKLEQSDRGACVTAQLDDLCTLLFDASKVDDREIFDAAVFVPWMRTIPDPEVIKAFKAIGFAAPWQKYMLLRSVPANAGRPDWNHPACEAVFRAPTVTLLREAVLVRDGFVEENAGKLLSVASPERARRFAGLAKELKREGSFLAVEAALPYQTLLALLDVLVEQSHSAVRVRIWEQPTDPLTIHFPKLAASSSPAQGSLLAVRPVGPAAGAKASKGDKPSIALLIAWTADGYTIGARGGFVPGAQSKVTVPASQGKADPVALLAKLKAIRTTFPGESTLSIIADPDAALEPLLLAADAGSKAGFDTLWLARPIGPSGALADRLKTASGTVLAP